MYPGFDPGTSDLFNDSVYVFDAVWTAALALHNASLAMTNQTLKDFDYNNGFISETIYNETLKTDFFGLSVSQICLCDVSNSDMTAYLGTSKLEWQH